MFLWAAFVAMYGQARAAQVANELGMELLRAQPEILDALMDGRTISSITTEQMMRLAVILGRELVPETPPKRGESTPKHRIEPRTPSPRVKPGDSPDPGPDEQPGDAPGPDSPGDYPGPTTPGDTPDQTGPDESPDPQSPGEGEDQGVPTRRPPDLDEPDRIKPWNPPKHPKMPDDEPPFGEPRTPIGPGRGPDEVGPREVPGRIGEIVDQIRTLLTGETPNEPGGDPDADTGQENPRLPQGEVPAPEPGDPLYELAKLVLNNYRFIYWQFTGNSPIGKVIHHAIEQTIFDSFPELFDSLERHAPGNLRGFWMSDNNEIHLSLVRIAWNVIYEALGIEPGKGAPPIPPERFPEVRRGLRFGQLLIDILIGGMMVPSPPIYGTELADDILRSLGVAEGTIDEIRSNPNIRKGIGVDAIREIFEDIVDAWMNDAMKLEVLDA
ncbi:hypothetical protein JVX90_18365 [Gordonia sp. PDNC005]|uniref:hypothetical protein n=1 Tax=unclassified Gordonia (in: high G+C Gram-positive bacteria) TaxID=2657482 RepID=UPI00196564EC|nr:hypothetical protein [Gordonia sp. PDNC005]QRY62318.1 hypothetical protein JVX90_18365 [Gordonia sp. PDNC005]